MARGNPQIYTDFSGGINADAAPYLLTEKQCRDARNVHTSVTGSIKKRNGFTSVGSLAASLDSVHTLYPINTATKSLLVVGKTAGAASDRICKVTTAGAITNLKSGLTQGVRWSWVMAPTGVQGPMYGMNGTDTPQYYDGTSAATADWTATLGTLPNGTLMAYHQTRIWVAGVANYPNRVYYSGFSGSPPLPDPRAWPTTNYVDIEPNDGDKITALGKVGPYLLVCKSQKTFVIQDPVSAQNRRISSQIGCAAPRSMVETDRGAFFLSDDYGAVRCDGQAVEPISAGVESILASSAATFSAYKNAAGAFDEGRYYVSIPTTGAANTTTLEFDLLTKSWWRHDCVSNQFALLDPDGDPVLYSINPSTPRLEKAFVSGAYQDAGANYTSGTYWIGPYYTWGAPHMRKRVTQFRLDGIGTWRTSYATNFTDDYEEAAEEIWEVVAGAAETTFGGTGNFGAVNGDFGGDAAAGAIEKRLYTPGFGRAWTLKFSNDDPYDMEIYSMTALLRGRKD